ncbi:hypothetical protein [Nocardia amamiensis]|uniref:hypothetical protein n=1 Tax=Nocardia amamiensis TaxID=404578 RepID=UPI0033E9EDA4
MGSDPTEPDAPEPAGLPEPRLPADSLSGRRVTRTSVAQDRPPDSGHTAHRFDATILTGWQQLSGPDLRAGDNRVSFMG